MASTRMLRLSFQTHLNSSSPQPSSSLLDALEEKVIAKIKERGMKEIKCMTNSANLGRWKACYLFAIFYERGLSIGDVRIEKNLAFSSECLLWGARKTKRSQFFFMLLRELASLNMENISIQKDLATCYYYGFGTKKDLNACISTFELCINKHQPSKNCSPQLAKKKLEMIQSLYRDLLQIHLANFPKNNANDFDSDMKNLIELTLELTLDVEAVANIISKYPSSDSLIIKHVLDYLDVRRLINYYKQVLLDSAASSTCGDEEAVMPYCLQPQLSCNAFYLEDDQTQALTFCQHNSLFKGNTPTLAQQSEGHKTSKQLGFSPSAVTSTPK
jgi:hypothetical protein